jgi:hypothetical protein
MKEALKLALEALENAIAVRHGKDGTKFVDPLESNAITAIKEALAQPEQEPVLEPACPVCSATPTFSLDVRVNEWSGQCKRCGVEGSPTTTEADAKRLWIVWHHKRSDTTPPKRPWVGLTDEEASWCQAPSTIQTWKRIEAKLKELNI